MLRRFHDDETAQGLVEYVLGVALLAHATVSSMKPGITPDLVIGTCVLIALAFVLFWLFDRDS